MGDAPPRPPSGLRGCKRGAGFKPSSAAEGKRFPKALVLQGERFPQPGARLQSPSAPLRTHARPREAMGRGHPGTLGLAVVLLPLWLSAWPHRGSALEPRTGRSARNYPHLEGDVRWRRLYCTNHFFLGIGGHGKVAGTRLQDGPNTIVEIRSVDVGTVVIRSLQSGFYLAMDKKGKVYGTKTFGHDCRFVERIEENGFNTYASQPWRHRGRPMFLALNGKGRPKWGPKTRREQPSAHFLPLLVS